MRLLHYDMLGRLVLTAVSDMDGIPKYPIQGIPIPKSPMGPMGDLGIATPAKIVAVRPIKVGVAVAPHYLL